MTIYSMALFGTALPHTSAGQLAPTRGRYHNLQTSVCGEAFIKGCAATSFIG